MLVEMTAMQTSLPVLMPAPSLKKFCPSMVLRLQAAALQRTIDLMFYVMFGERFRLSSRAFFRSVSVQQQQQQRRTLQQS
jgi:hypothetical protein